MIYLLAGHSNNDPGASGYRGKPEPGAKPPYATYKEGKVTEAALAKELRDLVVKKISLPQFKSRKPSVTTDDDDDSLKTVLRKIKSTESDIICDLHFNAAGKTATGVAVIHPEVPSKKELDLAKKLARELSSIMGLRNRGTMKPSETPRGRLGVMAKKGTNVLIEVAFITNVGDVAAYDQSRDKVALAIADILTLAHSSDTE